VGLAGGVLVAMSAGEFTLNVIFYALAALAIVCALAVCASRNIVRSAFALLGVLFAAAGFYLIAFSDFMMAIQVLVYIGGILVLVLFAIMLTHRIKDVNLSNDSTHGVGSILACACMAFALIFTVLSTRWPPYEEHKAAELAKAQAAAEDPGLASAWIGPKEAPGGSLTRSIGLDLTGEFLLPFEAISLLLLAALVGAAFLARKEVRRSES
jgi:NADH-quinone oxidoreductase subunit J